MNNNKIIMIARHGIKNNNLTVREREARDLFNTILRESEVHKIIRQDCHYGEMTATDW